MILRFFRLYDSSGCYSTIFPIVRFFWLLFSEFYAIFRFFQLHVYDSSDCYSLIFPILRVLRDSPMFPITRFYLHKHFILLYFFYIWTSYIKRLLLMLMDSREYMTCILRNHVLSACILSNKITRWKALFVLFIRKNNNNNDNKTTDCRRLDNRKNLNQTKLCVYLVL